MRAFTIGLVLAVVLLAAAYIAPVFMRDAAAVTRVDAQKQAELARRQMTAFDAVLPVAGARSALPNLKEADFDEIVASREKQFAQISQDARRQVQQAARMDSESPLGESDLQAVGSSPGAVRSAVGAFEQALAENDKLLRDAVRTAQQASSTDRNALGVNEIAGIAKLQESSHWLNQSRLVRARIVDQLALIEATAGQWASASTQDGLYRGMDTSEVLETLDADLNGVETLREQAQGFVDVFEDSLTARQNELSAIDTELEQLRKQRLDLEKRGFVAGQESSFNNYRDQYQRLSTRLRELGEREHLLRFGGIENAVLPQDNPITGEITGGEPVVALSDIEQALELSRDKVRRYSAAREALEKQRELVQAVGQGAAQRQETVSQRLAATAELVETQRAKLLELAQEARAAGDKAADAAKQAANAYRAAGSAVSAWQRDARTLQSEKDPQNLNPRLKAIIRDTMPGNYAVAGEAHAKLLQGRALAERVLSIRAMLETLRAIEPIAPTPAEELEALQAALTDARDQAIELLNAGSTAYGQLVEKSTAAMPYYQSSQAAAHHLLAQIDEMNEQTHLNRALELVRAAVADAETSPYLQQQVRLRDRLAERMNAPITPTGE